LFLLFLGYAGRTGVGKLWRNGWRCSPSGQCHDACKRECQRLHGETSSGHKLHRNHLRENRQQAILRAMRCAAEFSGCLSREDTVANGVVYQKQGRTAGNLRAFRLCPVALAQTGNRARFRPPQTRGDFVLQQDLRSKNCQSVEA